MDKPIMNFGVAALAALIPLVMGFIWYHKKTFGTAWMNETGMTDEKAKESNMALTFALTYILSFLVALVLSGITIHQNGLVSMFQNDSAGAEATLAFLNENIEGWQLKFRTFKHGALHGFIVGLFLVLPVFAVNSMFEQKSWSYIFINAGYWVVSITLMGGVVCAFT